MAILATVGGVTLAAGTASAHAIIDLGGIRAVAGGTSLMTLEIQHGCLPSESTLGVEAFVGRPWRGVRPQPVTGWQASVAPQPNGGWRITWVNLGAPIPFGTPTFLPIEVDWPKRPGDYGMRVTQQCTSGTSYDWSTRTHPATANSPSPPLTPLPEVRVTAAGARGAAGSSPATSGAAHPH